MEIEISKDISEDIDRASQELGLDKKELILRAIRLYLHNIAEYIGLKEELDAWERASTEDLINFEKQI